MEAPEQKSTPEVTEKKAEIPTDAETTAALKKEAGELRKKNDDLEGTLKKEKGDDNGKEKTEKERSNELFKEILKRELSVNMQQELRVNIYTNFQNMPLPQLKQHYNTIQRSLAFVSSHTSTSLGRNPALEPILRNASEQLAKEDAQSLSKADLEHLQANGETADDQRCEYIKPILQEMLTTVEEKIAKEMKENHKVDAGQELQERIARGETLKTVNAAPSGKDFDRVSKDNLRKFRDSIFDAKTVDNISPYNLLSKEPSTNEEKKAVKIFNALTDRFNEAMAHCDESGVPAGDKQARTSLLQEYGKSLMQNPLNETSKLPTFKEWLSSNTRKLEEAKKGAAAKKEKKPA